VFARRTNQKNINSDLENLLCFLTAQPHSSICTTRENAVIVGLASTATSCTTIGLKRVSEWIQTAATVLTSLTLPCRALGVHIESLVMQVCQVVLVAADETLENGHHKPLLNDTAVHGARGLVGVSGSTFFDDGIESGGGRIVVDFPWNALFARFSSVNNSAFVAFVKHFANGVNVVDWLRFTFSVIVVKVAPAAVLVNFREECTDHVGDGSVEAGVVSG